MGETGRRNTVMFAMNSGKQLIAGEQVDRRETLIQSTFLMGLSEKIGCLKESKVEE
jgi:hypothetical protein